MMPVGWTAKQLAEVADYNAGRTPARANPLYWKDADDGFPWVAISDMTEFGTVTHTKEKITKTAFDEVFRGQVVRAGTLIMSFKLTIGRVATLGIDACHNEAIISIYPKQGVDQRYLGYFLAQVDYDLLQDRQVKGNTLNQDKIDRIEIWLPPLDEQASIADALDLLRRSITLQERTFAVTTEIKRAVMRTLFTQGLRGEAQKEVEIGLVPESWEVGRLDRYAQVVSTRMTYSELEAAEPASEEDSVRVLGIKVSDMNLPDNEIELRSATIEKMMPRAVAERRCAPPRTIIFPKRGAAIATNKKRLSTTWTVFDPNVIGVISGNEVDQEYLFQWFQTFDLRTITEPGPTPQLNKKNLEPLIIPVPPTLGEQREVVATLKAVDRKIDLHRRKQTVLDELFRSLLHKLMTGEIRVTDLDVSALDRAALVAKVAA
jgi:type I restriction enzyme, S subunit